MELDLTKWSPTQRAAILARGENVLVSAGAGSGKTSVLVERVISCLVQKPPLSINRLLVVTFTEAAAAEMRGRIAKRLNGLTEQALGEGDREAVRYFSYQAALLETAQISTLHSFCMRIVKNNFLYLGIEPQFRILDSNESLLMRTGILQELLEQRLSGPDADAARSMMRQFRVSDPARMSRLVFRIDAFSMSQQSPADWLESVLAAYENARPRVMGEVLPGDLDSEKQVLETFAGLPWTKGFLSFVHRSLKDAKQVLLSALQLARPNVELASYTKHINEMLEYVDSAELELSALHLTEAAQHLSAAVKLRLPRSQEHPLKDLVKDKRAKARDDISQIAEILGRGAESLVSDIVFLTPSIRELVHVVMEFQIRYQEEKKRRGVLDFHDLEHYAYQVLTDPESGEAERLQEQFAEVFVDEYQDTSPIQDAIVRAIARSEGNVFTVGDVKQSIYRFRMAEPKLFLDQYRSLGRTEPGQVIDLVENYRSRSEVVNAVNFFFQQLFSEEFGGIRYDEKTLMKAGAHYPSQTDVNHLGGPVEFHLVSSEGLGNSQDADDMEVWSVFEAEAETGDDPSPAEADGLVTQDSPTGNENTMDWSELADAQREAVVVARKISEWMGTHPGSTRKQVWDAAKGCYRPLQYRDIVILLRSAKGSMTPFLEVLESFAIPAYGVTSTGFYGALEIRWLLAALSTIDNPRQELDLVGLLRSPLVGFSDKELALLRTVARGNLWDVMQRLVRHGPAKEIPFDLQEQQQALRKKVTDFLRQLGLWRTLARRTGAEEVVRCVIQDTGFLAYISAMPFGSARKANVDMFLDSTRAYDSASMEGVFGFVAEAKKRQSYRVDVGEARTLGENEDVVRLMTIHQSKGLEFPVVFLAGLGKLFHLGRDEQAFLLHRNLGFGPQLIDLKFNRRWWTMAGLAIREAELRESLTEEARILYVALTRAREKLVLIGSVKNVDEQLERQWERVPHSGVELPYHTLMQAQCYLDWLVPAVLRHEAGNDWRQLLTTQKPVDILESTSQLSLIRWNCQGGYALPNLPEFADQTEITMKDQAGKGQAVISPAMIRQDGAITLDQIQESLEKYQYEAVDTKSIVENLQWRHDEGENLAVPGKISATDLRRLWAASMSKSRLGHRTEGFSNRAAAEGLLEDPDFIEGRMSGRLSGIAFHTVMQNLDFATPPDTESVRRQLDWMLDESRLSKDQYDAVEVAEIVDFLRSNLGQRLARAKQVWREQPFFHRLNLKPEPKSNQDFVLVQGVIDCLAEEEGNWLIIDYKTDQVTERDVPDKTLEYQAQVAAYHEVMQALGGVKRVESYIYFVKPRVTVPMSPMDVAKVFRNGND